MSGPTVEEYRVASITACILLAGNPYARMTGEEYEELSGIGRTIVDAGRANIKMARAELERVMERDVTALYALQIIRSLDGRDDGTVEPRRE